MEVIRSAELIRGKRKIEFESGWTVWLSRHLDPGFVLKAGTEVDRSSFEKFILLHQYPSALEQAVALLALRSRSRLEIERKLRQYRYDEEVIRLVLFKLENEKLLNDEEFSFQWVESRSKKTGKIRLANELRLKGVGLETIRNVLESGTEEEELEHAVSLAEKKIRSSRNSRDDRKLFQYVTSFLMRRGFSWSIAKKACEKALGQNGSE